MAKPQLGSRPTESIYPQWNQGFVKAYLGQPTIPTIGTPAAMNRNSTGREPAKAVENVSFRSSPLKAACSGKSHGFKKDLSHDHLNALPQENGSGIDLLAD